MKKAKGAEDGGWKAEFNHEDARTRRSAKGFHAETQRKGKAKKEVVYTVVIPFVFLLPFPPLLSYSQRRTQKKSQGSFRV
jgi:hypothetical protein